MNRSALFTLGRSVFYTFFIAWHSAGFAKSVAGLALGGKEHTNALIIGAVIGIALATYFLWRERETRKLLLKQEKSRELMLTPPREYG